MKLYGIKNTVFQRMGPSFGRYFDSDHFMGQGALDSFATSASAKRVEKNQPKEASKKQDRF